MTFFYDLNKKLAALDQTQNLTEGQVAETEKWIQKAVDPSHKGDLHKALHVPQGEKIPKAKINKATHSSDPHLRHMAQFAKNVAKEDAVDEAMFPGSKIGDKLRSMKQSIGHSGSAKFGMAMAPAAGAGAAAGAAMQAGGAALFAPALGAGALGGAAAALGGFLTYKGLNWLAQKLFGTKEEALEFATAHLKAANAGQPQFTFQGKTYPVKVKSPEEAQGLYYKVKNLQSQIHEGTLDEEGGEPMTAKQKKFAKLAPPEDKITFADKIAGAKQEVDEMLGDVAAEAMKNALKGGQKKLDVNKNGKIDANDLAMLRAGKGKKQVADEGWDDMMKDVEKRRASKVGDVEHGAKHDIEHTATGRKVTRRVDDKGISVGADDDKPADGEKRGRGRPKKVDKAPERVTGKAYKHKGGRKSVEEGADGQAQQIYNDLADIRAIAKQAQGGGAFPQGFASRLESALWAAMTLIKNQQPANAQVREEELDEKAVSQQQQKFMGMVHAMQKGEKVKGASKELKKVAKTMKPKDAEDFAKTKHEGLPKKAKKKEESVEETTSSGSVATATEAPKKSKGGMQIGKGIYDSINRELEGMIAESMSVNLSTSTDDSGVHKNITVTASDDDAETLAQLLSRAGIVGGAHNHQEPCPHCGSTDCGCDETVEEAYGDTTATENKPDWPTDTEYSDDALQYSGGLNKPKTDVAGDGQTTVPNTAVHTQDEDELRRMMEMAGIQSELKPWERTMKEEQAVEEGVVDKVKDVVKKGLEKLGHGSDEEMRKDLQKKMGVEPTGKKPDSADDTKKMEESLMTEFTNFKI